MVSQIKALGLILVILTLTLTQLVLISSADVNDRCTTSMHIAIGPKDERQERTSVVSDS